MRLSYEEYKKKVVGCFLGKAVGGTLGAPYEGKKATHSLTYYDPVPTEMLPNDDLDLQVVWLEAIKENGLPINRKHLAEAWVKHVFYHFDEYGMAMRNINNNVQPPMSGWFNNRFYAGMGAAIRAELWASLAPANPELATVLAREDACVDHYSDGVDGTCFIAALESAAFVESDPHTLIDTALSFIPYNSRMAEAVRDTVRWQKENDDMFAIRELILDKYGACAWEKATVNWSDVTINVAFTILAWLCGENSFDKSICNAVNLGYDTDCTAGIVASLFAIIDPDCIDEKWLKPIGTDVVLSANILGMHNDNTIEAFCDSINKICLDVQKYYNTGLFKDEQSDYSVPVWTENYKAIELCKDYDTRESLVCVEPVAVRLFYPENGAFIPGISTPLTARLVNTSSAAQNGTLTLSLPDGWTVTPSLFSVSLGMGEEKEISFTVCAPEVDEIPYLNNLRFNFNLGGLNFRSDAGLTLAAPWLIKEIDELPENVADIDFSDAHINYAASFIQKIERGTKLVAAIDFKLWHFQEAKENFVAQGAPLKLFVDGNMILEHEAEFYTPSAHRFECSAVHELRGGWHRAVIVVDNTKCNSDELFFGIANMGGRYWYNQLEWRKIKR